jgi:hypothetical protein
MRNMRRRLDVLEGLPQFQPAASPIQKIASLALKQMSDEDLQLMVKMARDRDAGVCRTLSERELAALAADCAALETEARRMGFRSFADAERCGKQRR